MVSKTMNNDNSSAGWRFIITGAAALAAAGLALGAAAPSAHADGWAWKRAWLDYPRERAWREHEWRERRLEEGYYAPPRVIYQPAPHGYFYRDR